ncbi:hydroxysqualene dehydroxylase HpnE [Aquabacterium sp. A7-Y]|uniref:hydroxysqualene dehydroxylase HpnE n=1 Tax=Aquabacterium sp. A7-Y TaxID=1349605 RepID=UPI00223D5125|nr:hydroxysqualene dehydroxylase HpnE [Aquabacterium sp. A7-Y]MCW7541481.1 hydroxysqualene dehydroxylase HpnE [Aquabacterium sp. A7-Y]
MARRVAVVGGGWAGCAAAVQCIDEGHDVVLFEMARHLGGRARRVEVEGFPLDNGQHILIGAYTESLRLMRQVGVKTTVALMRTPLRLAYPDGSGLVLPPGRPLLSFALAVLGNPAWRWTERRALLSISARWALAGFRCDPQLSVAELCAHLPERLREDLIDPLCVAALNTPADQASAAVFLRVMKDALFAGRGSSDLLLPRTDLSRLFPDAAGRWLEHAGAGLRLGERVMQLTPAGQGWAVGDEHFDAIIVACSPAEAARLLRPHAASWASLTEALPFEPIITVYARGSGVRLPAPMLALHAGPEAPAQFVFDHGQLNGPQGLLAFVVSGAAPWVERGLEAAGRAVLSQAEEALGRYFRPPLRLVRTMIEKRATFLCRPGLQRPPARLAPRLWAAGDYVEGPYPATLEGAVRSGVQAARRVFD